MVLINKRYLKKISKKKNFVIKEAE